MDDVNESMKAGEAVDVGRAAFTTALNLLSQTVFSVDIADQSCKTAREFKETFWGVMEEVGKPNLVDYFPLLRKLDPQGINRRTTNYFRKTILIFDRMIHQRLESRKGGNYITTNDMLDNINGVKREDMDIPDTQHLFVAQRQLQPQWNGQWLSYYATQKSSPKLKRNSIK